jgi:hypothetical protein
MASERDDLAERTVRGVVVDRELVGRPASAYVRRIRRRDNAPSLVPLDQLCTGRMDVRLYDQNLDDHRQKAEDRHQPSGWKRGPEMPARLRDQKSSRCVTHRSIRSHSG